MRTQRATGLQQHFDQSSTSMFITHPRQQTRRDNQRERESKKQLRGDPGTVNAVRAANVNHDIQAEISNAQSDQQIVDLLTHRITDNEHGSVFGKAMKRCNAPIGARCQLGRVVLHDGSKK